MSLKQQVEDAGFEMKSVPSSLNCDEFWQKPIKSMLGVKYYLNALYWDNRAFPGGREMWSIRAQFCESKSNAFTTIDVAVTPENQDSSLKTAMDLVDYWWNCLDCRHVWTFEVEDAPYLAARIS